jgi:shikimate dehydrogenase
VLPAVKKLISNKIIIDNKYKKYSLIIGQNPSKGARSPKLWNAAFKEYNISCKMYPADLEKKNLNKFFKNLRKDPNFLAAAITNPYKEKTFKIFKKNSSSLTKKIQAGNCLLKKNNVFILINTDAEASYLALINKFKIEGKKKILILGYGGVGKAVANAFAHHIAFGSKIFVATRKKIRSKNSKIIFVNWKKIYTIIKKIDICINCTTVGAIEKNKSPIKFNEIKIMPKSIILYDIIYNPLETKFLKLGKKLNLKTLNGSAMNLLQAALAFNFSNKLGNIKNTMKIMKKVKI